ncbi:MAG: hypothetical protein RLZZ21_1361 [Planctomycetota bacterium]
MKPVALIAAGLLLLSLSLPAGVGGRVVSAPTAAVYVYEKDASAIPTGVTVGINRLNRERQIVATLMEDDTTDGHGDVPDQYREALDAARKAGMPALVVLSGSTVLSVLRAPTDADAIVRAVP